MAGHNIGPVLDRVTHRAPALGEHSREVLLEAGLTEDEVDSLIEATVVGVKAPAS